MSSLRVATRECYPRGRAAGASVAERGLVGVGIPPDRRLLVLAQVRRVLGLVPAALDGLVMPGHRRREDLAGQPGRRPTAARSLRDGDVPAWRAAAVQVLALELILVPTIRPRRCFALVAERLLALVRVHPVRHGVDLLELGSDRGRARPTRVPARRGPDLQPSFGPAKVEGSTGNEMIGQPEPACLLIADISGYTGYLAGVELDHAQDILADLVSTVVGTLRPMLRLAKLEGDAAFAYVVTPVIEGSTLQETVEGTYFAFRRRLRDIASASRCECNACIRIPGLDLKFVVHHGDVIRQRIAGREELLGSAVILVHRLLKNDVVERAGIAAYALYTADCIAAMGIEDPTQQGFIEHQVTTDIAGEVTTWIRDLAAAWTDEQARTRVIVEGRDVEWAYAFDSPAARQVTWDYITSPIRRPQWNADAVVEASPTGRRGAGTVNHCMHGKDAIVEEILDYRPYDYLTARSQVPVPGVPKLMHSYVLADRPDGGTHVELRFARPRPRDRAVFDQLFPGIQAMVAHGRELMAPLLAAEAEAARAGDGVEVPAGGGRYATEPITA